VLLARADVLLARHTLEAAGANVERAEASVRQAEAVSDRADATHQRWTAEHTRVRRLVLNRAATHSDYDAAREQALTAMAAVAESRAKLRLAGADRKARLAERGRAEANVQLVQAKLAGAEADCDRVAELVRFARITAPFDGVVTRRGIERGQLVQPAAGGTPGTPLFTVARTDRVRITVDVPEGAAAHVRKDMPASVRVQALAQRELDGTVARTSWALDTRTRSLRAQVELDNRKGLLRPGMFVSVRLTVQRPGVLTVPAAAVYRTMDERPYVVQVRNGRALRTYVQVGASRGDRLELLRKETTTPGESPRWEALTGQEEIVASNPAGYTDGQALTTRSATSPVALGR
jgi:multidrug efflux pump subunit AcrA (membrane-fusion protein)